MYTDHKSYVSPNQICLYNSLTNANMFSTRATRTTVNKKLYIIPMKRVLFIMLLTVHSVYLIILGNVHISYLNDAELIRKACQSNESILFVNRTDKRLFFMTLSNLCFYLFHYLKISI